MMPHAWSIFFSCALVALFACRCAGSAATCDTKLEADCGSEMKQGKETCLRCAQAHRADLEAASCTTAEIKVLCGAGPSPSPAGDMQQVLLDNSEKTAVGGRCLDGSPAGYYYGAASGNGTNRWVIFLKGGGACHDEDSCKQRAKMKNGLGSSTFWKDGEFHDTFTSNDPMQNPDFYDAHHVFVPYCTGDVHSGQRTSAPAETWNLWFDGHLNFKRILADLKMRYGLSDAKQVLLAGSSAGGIGTFLNADYLASQVPFAAVKAAPRAGWFEPNDPAAVPQGTGRPLNFTAKEVTHDNHLTLDNSTMSLYQSYAHPDCAREIGASNCGSVHNVYKYIATPLMIIENQYDSNQIFSTIGFCPSHPTDAKTKAEKNDYIAYYGGLMRDSIEPQVKVHGQTKAQGKDGLFLPSCLAHGGFGRTKVQNFGYIELVGDWFFEKGKLPSHVLIDDCKMTDGQPCNPTCTKKLSAVEWDEALMV